MKFAKAARETFNVENYNPPPGFYVGQDNKEKNALQFSLPQSAANSTQLGSVVSKAPRFEEPHKNDEGHVHDYQRNFGFDKIAFDRSLRESHRKQDLQQHNFVQQSQKALRRKTLSHKQTAQNLLTQMSKFLSQQPLGQSNEGFRLQTKQQILMEQLNSIQNQDPGPGQYDSQLSLVKPKIKGFKIKAPDTNDVSIQVKDSNQEENAQNLIWGKGLQTVYYDPSRRPSTTGNAEKTESDRIRKPPLSKNYLKQTRTDRKPDINLQSLLNREKNLPKHQEVPPPGWYYTEENFSQFGKLKQKIYQNQCFDSRQPRFKKGEYETPNPGPGEYDIPEAKPKNIVIAKTSNKDQAEEAPGVGDYELMSVFELKPATQKVAYPAVFGSSTKREPAINTQTNQVPGPGSYNIAAKFKKPLKMISRPVPQSLKKPEEPQQIQFGLSGSSEVSQQPLNNRGRLKAKNEGNKQHMFTSGVKRFAPSETITTSDLGPGVYNLAVDINRKTFNVSQNNFAQDERRFGLVNTSNYFQGNQKMGTSQSIGPGSYDAKIDPIKERKTHDIFLK